MKKFLALLMTLIMCFSFVACGSDDSSSTEGTDESSSFEEIVLFDTDEVTMKVTGYDPDGDWGFGLNVYVENNTDKTITFAIEDASVNGFMIDPFWATEVAPGKKENSEISWATEELESNDIENVENIEMKINVYDSEDWEADYLIEDTYSVKIPQ